MNSNIGKIKPVEITEEMQKSYLDYAMSVIVSRALPDVRDGLKPVHRRILYAMHGMGITYSSKHSKSAKVVGQVMGSYHPHGDMAIYDALVRLAQDFSLRYPLIDGQGNFGSIDGDSAAAMRYCVEGKTLVITNHGLERIETLRKRNSHFTILSFNNQINKATKWFDSGEHPTKTIKTYRGFSLCGTFNHPILIWKKEARGKPMLSWKLLQDVTPGDFAVINRSSLLFPKDPSLKEYYPKIKNKRIKKHQLPGKMSRELSFLLGALVSEGSVGKKQIGFCNNDKEFLKKFKSSFKKVFPTCRLHEFKRKPQGYTKKPYTSLEIHSLYILQFLENLGLKPGIANTKTVPEIIFSSSKSSMAAFLRAYAEGDGSVYLSGAPEICFISKSRVLMVESQLLLLRFGIDSSFRFQNSRQIYKLFIRGHENLALFQKEINFISCRKQVKLLEISQKNKNGRVMSKTDYIPYIGEYLRSSLKYRENLYWLKKHNLDRYPKLKKYWPKLKKILTEEDRTLLETLTEKRYLFDKIVNVSNSGEKRVFSLKVDSSCHSFVSNGFISHNTEVRMSKIAAEMLVDIEKNTVDKIDNFDASTKEPVFLPARIPNLLLMGADGIAVGMATKIPPHNLKEVVNGLLMLIDKGKIVLPEVKTKDQFEIKKIQFNEKEKINKIPALKAGFESPVTIEEINQYIKGPDFPTGASIYDKDQILQAYSTGKGKVLVRATAEIEETSGGRYRIIISQIPYLVNKSRLITRIAQLIKEKKIRGVSVLRDESDREGMRIVVELKRTAKPKVILNSLYKHTPMQTSYPVNMVALVNGTPQTLTLKQILIEFIKHRQQVITRRSLAELEEARKRAHILEGLKIALDNLDAVIATIKKSRTVEVARQNLIKKFKLSEIQANAILEMRLRRLAALERKKIEDEYKEIGKLIDHLTDILSHPGKILQIIKKELGEMKKKYGDPRKTKIYRQQVGSFSEEDLIAKEKCLIAITKTGYIKRLSVGTYRSQRRGGKGVRGMTTKEADEISQFSVGETHDQVLFFTNKGRVFAIRAWEIPEGARTSKGQAVINLINIDQDEIIHSVLNLPGGSTRSKYKHLLMVTKKGIVKKTSLRNFKNIRSSGLIAIKLNKNDELCWVKPTSGQDQVLIITHNGKSIRFNESDTRPMGRDTIGVRGILLKENDYVVGAEIFPAKVKRPADRRLKYFRDVLIVMENGLGKRTDIRYHPIQKRGGIGVKAANVTKKTGKIIASRLVTQKDKQVILTSKKAQVIKLPLKNIPKLGRSTQGVILMRFSKKDDSVAALTCLKK